MEPKSMFTEDSSREKIQSHSHRPPHKDRDHRLPHPQRSQTRRRIEKARLDLIWERDRVDGRKAIVDLQTGPGSNPRIVKSMSDSEATTDSSYFSLQSSIMEEREGGNKLFLLDPSQLDMTLCEDEIDSPGGEQQSGWPITEACLTSICNNLTAITIDEETLEALLAPPESSSDEIRDSSEDWRAALRKVVSEARRLGGPSASQIADSIMEERAKALTEAQMSLNDERIRLSKTKRAIRDRAEGEAAIAAEIEVLERESDELRKQLSLKEKAMEVRSQDLEAAEREEAIQQQKLERVKEAVAENEEIVSKVEASLGCERDRLKSIIHGPSAILHRSIA